MTTSDEFFKKHSLDSDERLYFSILTNRGGCRCSDPGTAPPCNNCTDEYKTLELEEALTDESLDVKLRQHLCQFMIMCSVEKNHRLNVLKFTDLLLELE